MKIDNLKQLKALIKTCRATGISKIEVDGVKLELGDEPVEQSMSNDASVSTDKIDTGKAYTEEEMLTWSSTPAGLEAANGN